MPKTADASVEHAALMDGVYATQRHIYDLTRKYYLLGRDRAIAELDVKAGQTVIEIGCGTGRNLILAAKKYSDVQFYGVDISSEMLATAEKNIRKAGLQDRIIVSKGDAAGFNPGKLFGKNKFDRVLMSYTLSMIPPWEAAIAQGLKILKKNGKLVFVDFWNQAGLPNWSKSLLKLWLDLFHVAPREGLDAAAASIAADQNKTCTFIPLYRGYACLGVLG